MADSLQNTNGRVREWIGPRIIPVFADEVQWDDSANYEPLMMVQNQGETFMSRQYVPAGAPLPDTSTGQESTDYWVHMSNWNAQVESYREEVMRYAEEVLTFQSAIDGLNNALPIADFDSTNTVDARFDADEADITALQNMLPSTEFDSTNTVDARFDADEANISALQAMLPSTEFDSTHTVDARFDAVETKVSHIKDLNLLCFGDSWLAQTTALFDAIKAQEDPTFAKNFGVSGAQIAQLTSQIALATADTSFDNDDINLVYIIAGTNNVYHDHDVTYETAKSVGEAFKDAFPNADIHYFPNNSRTANSKRNSRYMLILNGFGNAGIIVHPETLILPFYNNFSSYSGTDTQGVQHLTTTGYANFAYWCHTLRKGGNFRGYKIQFSVPISMYDTSSVTASSMVGQFTCDASGIGVLRLTITGMAFKSGYSSSSPGSCQILLPIANLTGSTTPIVFDDTYRYAHPCNENTNEIVAFAANPSNNVIQVPLKSGVTPTRLDIVFTIANFIGL